MTLILKHFLFVVVISSSCSTDETVVADSEAEEEETTSSVHMIDATEKAETPEKPAAIVIEDSPVTILEETSNLNEFKSVNLLADTESRGHMDEKNSSDSVTIRRDRNDEAETGKSEIIYTQDLIVRDLRSTRKVQSTGGEGVVDFKRFRKVKQNLWILDKCCVCEMMILLVLLGKCYMRKQLQ